jgi:hypothetical protein
MVNLETRDRDDTRVHGAFTECGSRETPGRVAPYALDFWTQDERKAFECTR